MKAQFLKIGGVKTEKEFYDKYPTEEIFFAKCGAKIKKAFPGLNIDKDSAQNGGNFMQNLTGGNGIIGGIMNITGGNPVQKIFDISEGLKRQKENVNKANQNMQVMGYMEDAKSSNDLYEQTNLQAARMSSYVRPEDNILTGEELFPVHGVGTNVLAKTGKTIEAQNGVNFFGKRTGGEGPRYDDGTGVGNFLRNIFNPKANDITDIDRFKSRLNSGMFSSYGFPEQKYNDNIKAQNGFLGNTKQEWGQFGEKMLGNTIDAFGNKLNLAPDDMGGQIGADVLGTVGDAILPGIGGQIGKVAGKFIGDALDRSDTKIKRYNNASQRSINNMIGMDMGRITRQNFGGNLEYGGSIPKYKDGGDINVYGEGNIQSLSNNPYAGEMGMIQGPSHEEGGVDMSIFGTPIEAEGGEPIMKLQDGATLDESVVILGNLNTPTPVKKAIESFTGTKLKGSKYKNIGKSIADNEAKINKDINKNVKKAENYTPLNSLDRISLDSLKLNLDINDKKQQKLAVARQLLSSIQELQNIEEGNARNGKIIYAKNGTDPITSTSKVYQGGQKGKENNLYGNATLERLRWLETVAKSKEWWKNSGVETDFTNPDNLLKFQELYNKNNPNAIQLQVDGKFGNQMQSLTFFPDTKKEKTPLAIKNDIPQLNYIAKGVEVPPITDDDEDDNNKDKGILSLLDNMNFKGTDAEEFNNYQLLPEVWAMANNKLEPVQAQKFNPRLRTPYDISLQDQLNMVTSKSRSAERMAAFNPEMLSSLKAEEYMADQNILGNQFRMNQQLKDQIYSGNLQALNDAQIKNLAIADQQYVRQQQANTNTKATDFEAIKSMTDKRLKHNLENQTLRVMENMYNYRFDPSGRARYVGPNADFSEWELANGQPVDEELYEYDRGPDGKLIRKKKTTTKKEIPSYSNTPIVNEQESKPNGNEQESKPIVKNGFIVKKLKNYK